MIPDFEYLAKTIIEGGPSYQPKIAEMLRSIWNARGTADKEAVDVEAHRVYAEASATGRTDLVVDLKGVMDALDA